MEDLTTEEVEMLRRLRDRGFAIVVFTPDELKSAPSDKIEDGLVQAGWDMIDILELENGK